MPAASCQLVDMDNWPKLLSQIVSTDHSLHSTTVRCQIIDRSHRLITHSGEPTIRCQIIDRSSNILRHGWGGFRYQESPLRSLVVTISWFLWIPMQYVASEVKYLEAMTLPANKEFTQIIRLIYRQNLNILYILSYLSLMELWYCQIII